jgi:NAD(P)-dependent dehydrogenase (short-subunit alcohol dehydrogenase family)
MVQKLKGKSAVVTGAGSGGIGRGVALALAAEGAGVVVNDIGRDADGNNIADGVVKEIKEAGGRAVANYDSVATMAGGENIIKTATVSFGRVDILVNCAGNYKRTPALEMTEKEWDSIVSVHLKGHFACSMAAIREMAKQQSGRIINFSSRAAMSGGGNIAYGSAKAGVVGLTLALALELKNLGITVNCIVPSADTKLFPGPRPKMMGGGLPPSLWLEPDYIAPIVAYLATDEAKDISGRLFYASGGDICIYGTPMDVGGQTNMFIRKMGKWDIDELIAVVPPLLGIG